MMALKADNRLGIRLNQSFLREPAPAGSYNGVLRLTYPGGSRLAPQEMIPHARIWPTH